MNDHSSFKLPADKRALLFRISSDEFAAKGFNQASLNQIISKMGMSKSSFYHYFSNKNDLFIQALNHAIAPMISLRETLTIETLTTDTLWPEIFQLIQELNIISNEDPDKIVAFRMFFRCYDDPEGRVLIESILSAFSEWMSRLIKHGQSLGMFRSDLPETLLINIIMSVGMSFDRWIVTNWEDQDDEAREALAATGLGLIMRILEPV